MDTKLKAEWIAALRSGKYKQGRLFLRDSEDNYCCLGVLCEIAGEVAIANAADNDTVYRRAGAYCYRGTFGTLSSTMLREFGMSANLMNKLMEMNDTERCSFDTIADYIEHLTT
jgi:hypothetical protein